MSTPRRDRPIYRLRLRQVRDTDDVRALRWALKVLLRRFGWRALSVEEERQPGALSAEEGRR
jgi:hypothetical protein